MNPNFNQNITETVNDLKLAKTRLQEIGKLYQNEPVLLGIYKFSAEKMVETLESHLEYLLNKETNSEFNLQSNKGDMDVWIKIEGSKFAEGKGPINVIGSYLQKLNTAARHSTKLVKSKVDELNNINFYPTFNLAETAKGSLKIGLEQGDIYSHDSDLQLDLFDDQSIDLFDIEVLKKKVTTEAIEVLFKALASANDETLFNELLAEYEEEDVIKLIHYAEELAPSNRSNIDAISFDGSGIKFADTLRTDADTRQLLRERAKKLKQDKEFVEGTAFIRQYTVDQNIDYYILTAAPFNSNEKKNPELELRADKKRLQINEEQVFGQIVYVSGFLHYNSKNQPLYIEVDSIEPNKFDADLNFN